MQVEGEEPTETRDGFTTEYYLLWQKTLGLEEQLKIEGHRYDADTNFLQAQLEIEQGKCVRENRQTISEHSARRVEEHLLLALRAEKCLIDAFESAGEMKKACLDEGSRWRFEGNDEVALIFYSCLIDSGGFVDDEHYYSEAADLYFELGRLQEAIDTASKGIRLGYLDCYMSRAVFYHKARRFDEALLDTYRILDDFNVSQCGQIEKSDIFILRGEIFLGKKEHDEAIRQFNTSLSLSADSQHPDYLKYKCYCGIAEAYLSNGNCDLAIHTLSQATKIQPDSGEAYGLRARAYRSAGLLEKALADERMVEARMKPPTPDTSVSA